MEPIFRKASLEDRPAISQLIEQSARALSRNHYSDAQTEAAIRSVFGVDSDLIRDGTYFVAETEGAIIGCGGWSKRRTLFGGDQYAEREQAELNPAHDAARIRAFFIHPDWARRGIGRAILERCEREAASQGFRSLELMATLPGVKFYRSLGYTGTERVTYKLEDDVEIDFIPMRKELA